MNPSVQAMFDRETQFMVSRSLLFQISPQDEVIASGSFQRNALTLSWDVVSVLRLFASRRSIRDAYADVAALGCGEEEFDAAIQSLLGSGLLVDATSALTCASEALFGTARDHHSMLKDVSRVMAYKTAIERNVANRAVVDLGTGTGILALFAARAGASRVDAIEETQIADVAQAMFNVNDTGCTIALHRTNSRNVSLPEPADVLVHEIIGVDPLAENVIPSLADARRRLLKPGGRMIPYRLEVLCFAFEVTDQPYCDKDVYLREATSLDGMFGLNFQPFRAALEALPSEAYERPLPVEDIATFRPRLLSDECQVCDIDFHLEPYDMIDPHAIRLLTIDKDGVLGGLYVYFRAHLDDQIQITNSPFAPHTSWPRGVRNIPRRVVRAGDTVAFRVGVRTSLRGQRLVVDVL